MQLIQQNPDLSAYLAADDVIDHHHPLVRETAARLAKGAVDSYSYARAAFEFVRGSDLLVTAPESASCSAATVLGPTLLPLPFELP